MPPMPRELTTGVKVMHMQWEVVIYISIIEIKIITIVPKWYNPYYNYGFLKNQFKM